MKKCYSRLLAALLTALMLIAALPVTALAANDSGKCPKCGSARSWGPWTVITQPGDFTTGTRSRICANCLTSAEERFYPEGTLMKGDKGSAVKALQQALNEAGYSCGKADGAFGKNTEGAVKQLEKDWGLTADGIAWPALIARLMGGSAEALTVEQTVTSAPGNKLNYTAGETVIYRITVKNNTASAVYDIEVSNPLKGGNEDAVVDYIQLLSPSESRTLYFNYTVTNEDVQSGMISGVTSAAWNGGSVKSDEVIVFTGGEAELINDAEAAGIYKTVTNTPANGRYFTEGETIEYKLIISNYSDYDLKYPEIDDPLSGGDLVPERIAAHKDNYIVEYGYIVTAGDVKRGLIVNTSTMTWENDGNQYYTSSNTVITMTAADIPDPIDMSKDVIVSLAAVNEPENGQYYTEGETIVYEVALENTSRDSIVYGWFNDNLLEDSITLDCLPALGCDYVSDEYTVTAEDAAQGYIDNVARLTWFDSERGLCCAYSDTLRLSLSPYGVKPVSIPVTNTETGEETEAEPEQTAAGNIAVPLQLGGEGRDYYSCTRNIIIRSTDSADYMQVICSLHAGTLAAANKLVNGAKTPEARLTAWESARAQWQKQLDALESALLSAADEDAKAAVLNEHALFTARLAAHTEALRLMYPVNPVIAAKAAAEMVMNRCLDMCYVLHNAPDDRADDLTLVDCEPAEGTAPAKCAVEAEALDESSTEYTIRLCAEHTTIAIFENAIMDTAEITADTWDTAALLWQKEAKNSVSKLTSGKSGEYADAVRADYEAYADWAEEHRELLTLLYKGKPEVAAQVYAQAMKSCAVELCAMEP